jgi:NADPH-dependent 2,4-dienoyl-CoA reductase/sulfur reductase-like enzyme/rhodanese-related sulfurtransferase
LYYVCRGRHGGCWFNRARRVIMSKKTIIVVGGQSVGLSAIAKARQYNEHARIIWIEQEWSNFWHYKSKLTDAKGYNAEIYDYKAQSLDVDARYLIIKNSLKKERLQFDSLIFLGHVKNSLPLNSEKVCATNSLEDKEKINKALKAHAHATILGLNLNGIETALNLKKLGFKVTLIDSKKYLPQFSLQFSTNILTKLSSMIELRLGEAIDDIKETDKINISSQKSFSTDLLIISADQTVDISLLTEADALGDRFLEVDDKMRTSLPNIYACGLAITVPTIMGERKWLNRPEVLLKTANIAGHNAAFLDNEVLKPLNDSLLLKIGEYYFARTGFLESAASKQFGLENIITTTVYQEQIIRLIVEKKSRCIIGGEVFGTYGVKRRIDLISMAITEGYTPKKLLELEMVDSKLIDPLQEAASRAHLALGNNKVLSADQLALWLASSQEFSLVNTDEIYPLDKLHEYIADKIAKPVVLYSTGDQSFLALQALNQRGLSNIYHLDGGALSWRMIGTNK